MSLPKTVHVTVTISADVAVDFVPTMFALVQNASPMPGSMTFEVEGK